MRWQTRVENALAERERGYREGVVRHGKAEMKRGILGASAHVMINAGVAFGKGDDKVATALRNTARELAEWGREVYP